MKRKQDLPAPSYYQDFFRLIEEDALDHALASSLIKLNHLDLKSMTDLHQKSYFPGKWTVNEILQHLIDTERIFIYRALHIARKDTHELLGFDQNSYAVNSNANSRNITDLVDELIIVRKSTIALFESFTETEIESIGQVGENQVSVEALGFFIIGHCYHHFDVIEERYYPLLSS